jgi:nucleoside-diphosphate-sugar epimerase
MLTGGTGFVGSHLAEALRRGGDDVTALVRSPTKAKELARLGVRILPGGLDDGAALRAAVDGQDIVYHVAGLVAARNEAEFLRANRDGTERALRAAETAGAGRFVLVSSMAAGGPAARGQPLSGDEAPRPVTAYGRSKLAGEELVRGGTIPWSIVRPPMVYGPRDREVLKLFQLARRGVAPVFGNGMQELSAIHAADLAAALIAAATAPDAAGRIYYACHPEIFTSAAFVHAVADALGRRVRTIPIPPLVGRAMLTLTGTAAQLTGRATILTADKAHEFFQPAWTGDPGPLSRDTGWTAELDLARGLADTAAWYQRNGWL